MILDSSVALQILLGLSEGTIEWYKQALETNQRVVCPSLIALEVARVLRRESVDPELGQGFVDELTLLQVDDSLLKEAAEIESHVRCLKALHLASAWRLSVDTVTVVTHDKSMATIAEDLGFAVLDPDVWDNRPELAGLLQRGTTFALAERNICSHAGP